MSKLNSGVMQKCFTIFSNLGWEVSVGESYKFGKNRKSLKPTFILRYNGVIYGFVEVMTSENLVDNAKKIKVLSDIVINELKPRVFIVTNGYAFDVYHLGQFYGTLSVPPAPEIVDILLSNECCD